MAAYTYTDCLETSRFKTRYLELNDIDEWTKFFDDKDCAEFLPNPGFNSSQERAKHWIEKQLDRYSTHRYGLQALINKDTNEFVGQCGLLLQEVDNVKQVEVGYHIFKKFWGQGYAPEAAKLFINYAFDNDQTNSVISIINVGNIKSQRVAHKNGLTKRKQTRWTDLDVFIYQLDK